MKKLVLILISIISCCNVFATHVVGGSFSLKWISGKKYELTLNVMRDCKNSTVGFDEPATVGVFDKTTHELIQKFDLSLTSDTKLNFANPNCQGGPAIANECTSLGVYKRTITLSADLYNNNDGYYFSYQRCCRNGVIQNLQNPADAGIAIYMEIPSPRFIVNSTPNFTANPNTYLCVGNLTRYNFEFTDPDGDELRYELVTPINGTLDRVTPMTNTPISGPYPRTNWAGSYSDSREILGNPSLSINGTTGEISVNPIQAGIYAVAILISEYRFGVKLGEVRLEVQLTITECPQPVPGIVYKQTDGSPASNAFNVELPGKICFDIEAFDPTDSLFMTVLNISADTTVTPKAVYERSVTGFKKISNKVCLQTDCSIKTFSTQTFSVEVKDNGCPISTRSVSTFTITPKPMPLVNSTDILCMTLVDRKETIFYWGDSTGNNRYFNKYLIYRSAGDNNFIVIDSIANKNLRQYNDKNTPEYDLVNYRYYMRAQNLCGIEGPPSDTLGTFEQLKFIPDKQKLVTVSVCEKNKLKIIWPKSLEKDFARYLVYKKKTADKDYSLIYTYTKVTDTVFIDSDVDVNGSSYCYHVVMKDTCDNYGPAGYEACSILLKGKSLSFANKVSWNAYSYWETGIENYEVVVKGNEALAPVYSIVAAKNNTYEDIDLDKASALFTYYVVAHQKGVDRINYGGTASGMHIYEGLSISNEIDLSQKPYVFVPNAFTPNNDDLNEDWNIRDLFVKDYHLVVYNKWGELIFETTDKRKKWDGKSENGDYQPTDVYLYQLRYTGFDDYPNTLRGNVTILR
jgi:gliding motility-associated-like protein